MTPRGPMPAVRRLRFALVTLGFVLGAGTLGYVLLGLDPLDALYQTVTTVTTVGFREVHSFNAADKIYTIVLMLGGVGTALYAFGVLLELLVEGDLERHLGRRRMTREIGQMRGHVILCGWGRVGKALAGHLRAAGEQIVVVDRDPARLADLDLPHVEGDVTDDAVLHAAGIERARVLVAALATDADNVFVTLSARTLRPDLLVLARARTDDTERNLRRAGANRVVNAQRLGGERLAAFARQPHVADFLDVVMHDRNLEFRLEEVTVDERSPLATARLADARIAETTGALLLALRDPHGAFLLQPGPDTVLLPGTVLIVIGTESQVAHLRRFFAPRA